MNHDNKPLTLEEMYKMEGEPVWVVSLSQKGEKTVHQDWFIVVIEDLRLTVKRPLEFGHYICGADTYGKTWLAYAQKPIDFDEWEPCAKCRSCFSCAHVVENAKDSRNACFWCEHMDKFKPLNFCSRCGRPLTDEAKQMLERRLENANK